jgi:hypothetical protein
MTPADSPGEGGPRATLISGDALFGSNPADPRPLSDAPLALERLRPVGQAVVLVGDRIAGRMLPADPADRLAWIRSQFDTDDLAVVAFDETAVASPGNGTDAPLVGRWNRLREAWGAERLITPHAVAVGPARRAGLTVIRIGPGDGSRAGSVERADHVVRDLLDAVRCVITTDAFAARP